MLGLNGNNVTASSFIFNFDDSLTPTVSAMDVTTASAAGKRVIYHALSEDQWVTCPLNANLFIRLPFSAQKT